MNEQMFTNTLQELLDGDNCDPCAAEECEFHPEVKRIAEIKDSGYLTNDVGLVVTMENGDKFMVTVQQVA